jgi:hypothetical protein
MRRLGHPPGHLSTFALFFGGKAASQPDFADLRQARIAAEHA